jgi:catechol 2,3-dioxygenase-like lactoylglutathione lyase family enzyme
MLDHISLRVQDHSRAVAFYRAALAPLGYRVLMEYPGAAGLGAGMPDFWLMTTEQPINPTHVAFSADRATVDAFHAAALAAGGSDNGPPGLRSDYHPHYYGAFVRDPEGNNVEVVCHADPDARPAPVKKAAGKSAPRAARAKPKAKVKTRAKAKASRKANAKPRAKAKPAAKKKRR